MKSTSSAQAAGGAAESSPAERLSPDERVQRALEILRAGRISVLDFMIKILNPHEPAYAAHRDRLYTLPRAQTTGKLARFLDLIYGDKRGRKQIMRWMEPHAVELVTKKVYQETDTMKVALRQPIDSVTHSTALSLSQLFPEVLHVIFHYLDIPDILRLRRVSRYLNGISHSRQAWTNAYRTAEFVRPPGPFLWQSTYDLEKALVCGFRVDRNLRSGSGAAQTEKPALKMREIWCKDFYSGVNLVFGRFVLIGFRNEICCYDLNIEVLDSNRDPSIIYQSPGQQLGEFRCVSSFDVEGRPFACAVLLDFKGATPQFSIYSLHVGEQSGVTLDLLHQFVSSTTFIDSINLGPRVIVFQNDKCRRVVALDVHTRTEFLVPSIHALMEAAGITESVLMHSSPPTSISTSTHVVMGKSYFSGNRWTTFLQAFPLPPSNIQCPSTLLSPSHRGVIFNIQIFDNALLHDTVVDSSTRDVLIAIQVHTRTTRDLRRFEHGVLRLSTDGTITFQLLGALGQLYHSPYHRPSGSNFHGSGRAFIFEQARRHRLISALDYDLRASGNHDNETKVAEYPHIMRCSTRHDLLDYDPYSGRLCLAGYPENLSPPVIEIVDLAI